MRLQTVGALGLLLNGLLAACDPRSGVAATARDSTALHERRAKLAQRMAAIPDSTRPPGAPVARWILPEDLTEVSGLAVTADGRLLAHDDERATVSVVDPLGGAVLKRFGFGSTGGTGDFEGITVANGRIYVLESTGIIHEFVEGGDGERVAEVLHDTELGQDCEFEGIAYDSASAAFAMACKQASKKSMRKQLTIYRWKLDAASQAPEVLAIPLSFLGGTRLESLHPSDIAVDPATGNYVVLSAQERVVVEVTREGEFVRAFPLPGTHEQAEGVAITRDGLLIVGDEGVARPGALTLYRWRPIPSTPEKTQ